MVLIASADLNWGIGYKGKLLKRIPEDMKNVRRTTVGNTIVMGRKTFDSLPNKKPLDNRRNIVLTKNRSFNIPDVETAHNVDELLGLISDTNPDKVFVFGGSKIYSLLLPYCNMALITKFMHEFTADTYLENLDKNKNWELVYESPVKQYENIPFRFTKYKRS